MHILYPIIIPNPHFFNAGYTLVFIRLVMIHWDLKLLIDLEKDQHESCSTEIMEQKIKTVLKIPIAKIQQSMSETFRFRAKIVIEQLQQFRS